MADAAEARAWWADVEEVRERIERRRERERRALAAAGGAGRSAYPDPAQRGVREVRPGRRLMLVPNDPQASTIARTRTSAPRVRPRPRAHVGPHPDRIAAWAVALGVISVLAALLSSH